MPTQNECHSTKSHHSCTCQSTNAISQSAPPRVISSTSNKQHTEKRH